MCWMRGTSQSPAIFPTTPSRRSEAGRGHARVGLCERAHRAVHSAAWACPAADRLRLQHRGGNDPGAHARLHGRSARALRRWRFRRCGARSPALQQCGSLGRVAADARLALLGRSSAQAVQVR
jgi:hypothetical protein